MPWRTSHVRVAVASVALLGLATGCAGRGSTQDEAVGNVATRFLAAASSAPDGACAFLAPATVETLQSDGEDCASAMQEVAPDGDPTSEPEVEVYGREAMVRWDGQTLFLSRFDDGWRVTAAGCESRGDDLPYDCTVEGR